MRIEKLDPIEITKIFHGKREGEEGCMRKFIIQVNILTNYWTQKLITKEHSHKPTKSSYYLEIFRPSVANPNSRLRAKKLMAYFYTIFFCNMTLTYTTHWLEKQLTMNIIVPSPIVWTSGVLISIAGMGRQVTTAALWVTTSLVPHYGCQLPLCLCRWPRDLNTHPTAHTLLVYSSVMME